MDNLVIFSFFRKIVSVLHWIFYGLWILGIIINAEMYFFGVKYRGDDAIIINLTIGISGIVLGYFILKQNRLAYFGGLFLFVLIMINFMINYTLI